MSRLPDRKSPITHPTAYRLRRQQLLIVRGAAEGQDSGQPALEKTLGAQRRLQLPPVERSRVWQCTGQESFGSKASLDPRPGGFTGEVQVLAETLEAEDTA